MNRLSKANQTVVEVFRKGYRLIAHTDGTIGIFGLKGQVRRLTLNPRGYLQFSSTLHGRSRPVLVHKFVAYCKYGDALFEAECVRHLDGNAVNNSWGNIAIGTLRENMADMTVENRTRGGKIGAALTRKLTDDQVRSIRYWCNRFHPETGELFTNAALARIYGVNSGVISQVTSRRRYVNVP